jgi:hypothetical protein
VRLDTSGYSSRRQDQNSANDGSLNFHFSMRSEVYLHNDLEQANYGVPQ